jgi:hypothetical protein
MDWRRLIQHNDPGTLKKCVSCYRVDMKKFSICGYSFVFVIQFLPDLSTMGSFSGAIPRSFEINNDWYNSVDAFMRLRLNREVLK